MIDHSNCCEIISLTRDEIKERHKLKKHEETKRLFQECRDGVVNPNYKLRISKTSFGDMLIVDRGLKKPTAVIDFVKKQKS